MLLTDLVAPNAIIPALKVNSKKQVLQELAAKAAELSGDREKARTYYASLLALGERADTERPELNEAKVFLARK